MQSHGTSRCPYPSHKYTDRILKSPPFENSVHVHTMQSRHFKEMQSSIHVVTAEKPRKLLSATG